MLSRLRSNYAFNMIKGLGRRGTIARMLGHADADLARLGVNLERDISMSRAARMRNYTANPDALIGNATTEPRRLNMLQRLFRF